jgi:lysozyme
MNEEFTVDIDGLSLTESFEGCKLTAYRDLGGVLTIGYGHTGMDVYEGRTITHDEAVDLLREDMAVAEGCIKRYVKVPLTQHQFDALVDFAFNVGIGNFKHSTLLAHLNSGYLSGAEAEFQKWATVNGSVVAGLLRRRQAETKLFDS